MYISAIQGHVPNDMVRTFRAFLEICYIVRKEYVGEDTLMELDHALKRFHKYRRVFLDTLVREHFDLPRQHALLHYPELIRLFGAPNGHCTVNHRECAHQICQRLLSTLQSQSPIATNVRIKHSNIAAFHSAPKIHPLRLASESHSSRSVSPLLIWLQLC